MKKIYIDFEMNMQNSKSKRDISNADIIAIGAVMFDTNTKKISRFKSLIKPVSNSSIYDHITDLTGISDEDVKEAPTYEEVMRKFKRWLGDFSEIKGIYTFGNLDLTCFISTDRRSAQKNNHPRFVTNIKEFFIDIKEKYCAIGIKCIHYISLKNLLECMNVDFDGEAHDPLADAYNLYILDEVLSKDKIIRELLIIKDIVRSPFIDLNPNLEYEFEKYSEKIYANTLKNELDYISIEVLKTLRLYLMSINDIDIYNIEYLKDISRKLNVFDNIRQIEGGYFDLIDNVYFDMEDILEDLYSYKLGKDDYQTELDNIIAMFEEDMEYENIIYDAQLQRSC